MTQLKQYPRQYLRAEFDPAELEQITTILAELENRDLPDRPALEQWCLDFSEFDAAVEEEGIRRYIDYTRFTEDAEIGRLHMEWIEQFQPSLKPRVIALKKKLAQHPTADLLPPEQYGTWLRSVRNSIEIFREENVTLETEIDKLQSEYDKIIGGLTVSFDGQEQTFPQMARYQEETDRALRERAYCATQSEFSQQMDTIETVLDNLLDRRGQAAQNAGFDSYRELCYRQLERFDYGARECEEFHDSVQSVATPLLREIRLERQASLQVETLRPWDLRVDPQGREPLRPFTTAAELSRGCRTMFERVDPALGHHFDVLIDGRLLDLESRKGKAPGGYQETYPERRVPFIFMNAAGTQSDVETLLHEGGHAFHALECRDEPLVACRDYPIEFAEVASMSMELLALPHLDAFYSNPDDVRRVQLEFFENLIGVFPWVATIDAFQHWLYANPGHSREERLVAWKTTQDRFGAGVVDYTGLDDAFRSGWMRQLHIFVVPFYYIEYAIAQLGALQVWLNYREDPKSAVELYRHGLSLGGTKKLPELFEATGIRFDFSASMLERLLGAVAEELQSLRQLA